MKRTSNVFWQEEGDSFTDLLKERPSQIGGGGNAFLHLINIYAPRSEEETATQHSVLQSMRQARQLTKEGGVRFVGVCEDGDAHRTPEDFIAGSPLNRNVADDPRYATFRPLPYLFDLLEATSAVSAIQQEKEYLVFTNFDIVLQPWFYTGVASLLKVGHDCLIINRRTISKACENYPDWVARAEIGLSHPGMDCFVFPRCWIPEFTRTDAVIGAGFVMRSLLYNLVVQARSLLFVTQAQMTYHFGNDRPWRIPPMDQMQDHNTLEAKKLWRSLCGEEKKKHLLDAMRVELPWFDPEGMRMISAVEG